MGVTFLGVRMPDGVTVVVKRVEKRALRKRMALGRQLSVRASLWRAVSWSHRSRWPSHKIGRPNTRVPSLFSRTPKQRPARSSPPQLSKVDLSAPDGASQWPELAHMQGLSHANVVKARARGRPAPLSRFLGALGSIASAVGGA